MFISRINTTTGSFNAKEIFIFFYEQFQFNAVIQLSMKIIF